MSLDEQLSGIRNQLDKLKTEKIENETRLKDLEREKQDLLRQCEVMGVNPKEIDKVIAGQENEIEVEVKKLRMVLDAFGSV